MSNLINPLKLVSIIHVSADLYIPGCGSRQRTDLTSRKEVAT